MFIGFTFKIDQTKTHPSVKVSRDFLSFRVKSTDSRDVFTNAVVKSGQHFWQIKVDQIIMKKETRGSISLGVVCEYMFCLMSLFCKYLMFVFQFFKNFFYIFKVTMILKNRILCFTFYSSTQITKIKRFQQTWC